MKAKPGGLLLHEDLIWSLVPVHLGMQQYWRDLDSLERWTRSEPHRRWWQDFLKDTGGTGFWPEAHFMRGGGDAIYADMIDPTGLARFAPAKPARGAMFSAGASHRTPRGGPDRGSGDCRAGVLRSRDPHRKDPMGPSRLTALGAGSAGPG
jgi:hypothetical protein